MMAAEVILVARARAREVKYVKPQPKRADLYGPSSHGLVVFGGTDSSDTTVPS